ncbi:MAG: hypothetical protein J0H76_06220 [Sphingobacteriales bacterium]|nr:hypothetical protein [Sphingobacteriales bacterium]
MVTEQVNQGTEKIQPKKAGAFKKFMRWFFFFLFLFSIAFGYWKYFYTYSDGYRSGLLQKFSRKGNIFKTYEGELILSTVVSSKNIPLASEKFFFSVANDSLAKLMQNFEGKNVRIHYVQKNGTLMWRGESQYIVDEMKLDERNP